MKRNLDNIINNYYTSSYDEDERLTKDLTHHIEYITTTHYIDKYLKPGMKILEVGPGTGIYSRLYASKGYEVKAIELSSANVEIMKKKITPDMNLEVIEGNAIDLSIYKDETFDMTLVLGPLYHIFKPIERIKAIEEAKRVTKKGGLIYIAFILTDITIVDWGFKRANLAPNFGNDKMITEDYKAINKEEYVFYMSYLSEVKELLNKIKNIKPIHYIATDGLGHLIADTINEMDEEAYKHYINYHLSICEREDLIGYSGHILAVAKKD